MRSVSLPLATTDISSGKEENDPSSQNIVSSVRDVNIMAALLLISGDLIITGVDNQSKNTGKDKLNRNI